MDINDVRTLYAYNRWANQRMFAALEKLSEEQFTTVAQSSFPSIRESVFHILAAEWLWLKRWKGESPRAASPPTGLAAEMWNEMTPRDKPSYQQLSTVSELRAFADAIDQEREEFVQALGPEEIRGTASYFDMAGKPQSEPLAQLMQHVVNHGTYHRGQVTTLLRQVGGETVSLDMLYFFREQQGAAVGR